MSKAAVNKTSPVGSKVDVFQKSSPVGDEDEDWATQPQFIYGGPFVKHDKPSLFLDTATPMNLQLQGSFKKSFAYYSLKERMPVILTKVIDYCSRQANKIKSTHQASDQDIRNFIQYVTKLKNDLVTNKKYDLLTVDTPEAKRWNQWIEETGNSYYFTNVWVFTECYIYRRLREGCELQKGLQNFDPFDEQKDQQYMNSLEPMCIAAEKVVSMLSPSDKEKRKADFITLLKLCLWANKCDLSLSLGAEVNLTGEVVTKTEGADPKAPRVNTTVLDPLKMIMDFNDRVLVDDSSKATDAVIAKAEAMAKAIEGAASTPAGAGAPGPEAPADVEAEEPKIPCPAKMVLPQAVIFDIVCDNAGYEVFADLCLAHFLVAQKIVQKVRFHLKKIPWFVSDVTLRDFKYVISQSRSASYNREVPQEPKPDAPDVPSEPRKISSNDLQSLGNQWQAYVDDGTFIVMCDDFWTSPHVYKDMKKYDPTLYRKIQYAVAVLFKGDLNYRKLLGERNCNPTLGFEPALQGFHPAPLIALRTVKADLICGLPKGKAEQISKIDEKWMETGNYGVIQFCPKAEPLKPSDQPCVDYGDTCYGTTCPLHKDI